MLWAKIRWRGLASRFASRLSRFMFSSIALRPPVAWPALFASHRLPPRLGLRSLGLRSIGLCSIGLCSIGLRSIGLCSIGLRST